jgi:hypothetical protein
MISNGQSAKEGTKMAVTAKSSPDAAEVRKIVGDVDDAMLTAIIATGATAAEITEALLWVKADDDLGTDLEHSRRGVVGQVYEILQSEEPEDE